MEDWKENDSLREWVGMEWNELGVIWGCCEICGHGSMAKVKSKVKWMTKNTECEELS